MRIRCFSWLSRSNELLDLLRSTVSVDDGSAVSYLSPTTINHHKPLANAFGTKSAVQDRQVKKFIEIYFSQRFPRGSESHRILVAEYLLLPNSPNF